MRLNKYMDEGTKGMSPSTYKHKKGGAGGKGLIIHVWKEPNGTFRFENQYDEVIDDDFETSYDAEKYAGKMYPKAKIYGYKK